MPTFAPDERPDLELVVLLELVELLALPGDPVSGVDVSVAEGLLEVVVLLEVDDAVAGLSKSVAASLVWVS